jgi:hypothetical protein
MFQNDILSKFKRDINVRKFYFTPQLFLNLLTITEPSIEFHSFSYLGMNSLIEFLVSMLKIDENKPSNAFYSIESGF